MKYGPEQLTMLPKHEIFPDWSEAFDCCRERDRPIIARVDNTTGIEINKIFPSGSFKVLYRIYRSRDGILFVM